MKSPAAKMLTVSLALCAFVAGAYIYGIIMLRESKVRVETLRKDVAEAEKRDAEVTAIRTALDEFRAYQEAVDTHLVDTDGVVDFVERLEETATIAGVSLRVDRLDVAEVEPKALSQVERLNVGFSVRGTWDEVMRFAYFVDALPYQAYVSGAVLSTDKTVDDAKRTLWSGSWNVSVPKLKESQE